MTAGHRRYPPLDQAWAVDAARPSAPRGRKFSASFRCAVSRALRGEPSGTEFATPRGTRRHKRSTRPPRTLTDALGAGGAEAKRAFAAMMTMQKIDVARIDAARRG
jgi:hypothetical protein